MKTFKFSLVLRTLENTDVFISLDDNIYGIHSKRVNILYVAVPSNEILSWRYLVFFSVFFFFFFFFFFLTSCHFLQFHVTLYALAVSARIFC